MKKLLWQLAEDDDTVELDYTEVFERLRAKGSESPSEVEKRRAEAERLAAILLNAPQRRRYRKLKSPRYQSIDLAELFLQESHSLQLTEPGRALEHALLAYRIALHVKDAEDREAALAQATLLEINARRLLGEPRGQEAALSRAAAHARDVLERACFCRAAALVRWEQARSDEASALLQQAIRLYKTADFRSEEAACMALLGLLYSEEHGLASRALPLLVKGWASMDRDLQPLLTQRVGLALVVCLAEAEQTEEARAVLQETWKFYSSVTPPDVMLRVYWREALALAALQSFTEAEHLLRSIAGKLVEEGSVAEALVVWLHLYGLLVETGRPAEIEQLDAVFGPSATANPVVSQMVHFVGRWPGFLNHESPVALREHVRELCADLLRGCRRNGFPIKPLPFL